MPPSTRAAALTSSAWVSRTTVVTVGDFVPRSMSEIIEDEMPLRAASVRKLKPAASRCCLIERPVRSLTSSSFIVHHQPIQAKE